MSSWSSYLGLITEALGIYTEGEALEKEYELAALEKKLSDTGTDTTPFSTAVNIPDVSKELSSIATPTGSTVNYELIVIAIICILIIYLLFKK